MKCQRKRKRNRITRRQFLKRAALATTAATAGSFVSQAPASAAKGPAIKWNKEADVVVIGAGAMGLPAAILAREAGARVILVEAAFDIGGHAITSDDNIPLGGGTSAQKKAGSRIRRTSFLDLTDWSIVRPDGIPDYRKTIGRLSAPLPTTAPRPSMVGCPRSHLRGQSPDTFGGTSLGNRSPARCIPPQ